MKDSIRTLLVVSLALVTLPAIAQDNSLGAGCGDPAASFSVKTDRADDPPSQPDPGKALVFVLEDDSNFASFPKPTTRAGIDGKWMGATHGNSYLYFSVDPGVHHLCASWQKGVILTRGRQTSALHFTADPGGVYYFEVKNVFQNADNSALMDSELKPVDSDEGQVLVKKFQLSTSHPKH